MRIIQIVEGYRKGDGVGNVVTAIDEFLKKNHYETMICSRQLEFEDIESELFGSDTIVFYHMALLLDSVVKHLRCKKVLIFHNITEPELLEGADEEARINCSAGHYDAMKTADYFDAAVTFSEYSRRCLNDRGWKPENISMLPILVRLQNFSLKPSREVIERYRKDTVNILFTGRVYPNKKHEDIIAAFAAYKERYQKKARLFLVGSISKGNYYPSLLAYAEKLGVLDDVVFPGHVTFEEYLAYYHIADLYLCMSAHEGFCIPLVEAMYFGIPIIAHASTAVPDTLAGSGVLLQSREAETVAKTMNEIISNNAYRQAIIEGQNKRQRQLLPEVLEGQYITVLKEIVDKLRVENDVFEINNNSNKYRFSLVNNLLGQIEQFAGKKGIYVIYGAGAAGVRLYTQLKKGIGESRLILCDTFKAGSFNSELGCNIISPKQAVESYREGVFVISLQDKRLILDITAFLLELGIRKEQIFIYDKLGNKIV